MQDKFKIKQKSYTIILRLAAEPEFWKHKLETQSVHNDQQRHFSKTSSPKGQQ